MKHILGLQKENDVWRRTNKELLEVYEEQSVVNVGKFHDLSGQAMRLEWWKTDHPVLSRESSLLVSRPSWTKRRRRNKIEQDLLSAPNYHQREIDPWQKGKGRGLIMRATKGLWHFRARDWRHMEEGTMTNVKENLSLTLLPLNAFIYFNYTS